MIEVKNLAKRFRSSQKPGAQNAEIRESGNWFHAVRDVSFSCAAGEVLGLLGPNGAGKTTTLRLLATALVPDSGSAFINGIDIVAEPMLARKQIGFLSGTTGLYGRLTAWENVEYSGRLHGLGGASLKRRCEELFDQLQMTEFAHKRADALSAGMKQKCSIARSVIHDPKLIIFDEPTTGLDVMAASVLMDFMQSLKDAKIPLIFSTHHLHEIEKLCDRVCIINRGLTVFNGTPASLKLEANDNIFDAFVQVVSRQECA